MNPIVIVLSILLLTVIVPKRHSEKTEDTASLKTKMQTTPEKETVKPENADYADNDCTIYWYVIDINSL